MYYNQVDGWGVTIVVYKVQHSDCCRGACLFVRHTVAQLGKHVRLYLTSPTIDVQAQNPAFSCPLAVKVRIITVM